MSILSLENSLVLFFIVCLWLASKLLSFIPTIYLGKFDSTHRRSPLDGLRGILALSVMTHHFYLTYQYKLTGSWTASTSLLLENLGGTSVSVFFLITGYLFLKKIQTPNLDWKSLYLGRIKRIMPLFYAVVIVISGITFYVETVVNARYLTASQVFMWFFKWLIFYGDNFLDSPSWLMIAGVHWSLLYEWTFYFSLPMIYLLIHKKFPPLFILALSLGLCSFYYYLTYNPVFYYVLFGIAYLVILLKQGFKKILASQSLWLSMLLIILTIFIYLFTKSYTWVQFLLLGGLFGCIANGYTFHNLLLNKGLCLLGDTSYSIYLWHGVVLYIMFTLIPIYEIQHGLLQYYAFYPLIFAIIVVISLLSYRYIEIPFIQKRPHAISNVTPQPLIP